MVTVRTYTDFVSIQMKYTSLYILMYIFVLYTPSSTVRSSVLVAVVSESLVQLWTQHLLVPTAWINLADLICRKSAETINWLHIYYSCIHVIITQQKPHLCGVSLLPDKFCTRLWRNTSASLQFFWWEEVRQQLSSHSICRGRLLCRL